ncbi:MAG TPA: hypothetical protein VFU01_11715 [Gemmatimonadaceae bacterium]|nr:hypothetical protein [Gemmatimonadaceae bacterium]
MLTTSQLVSLERSLRDKRVLSVYLDGTAKDPAQQRAWRKQLDHSLDDLRSWLAGSSRAERDELEQCLRLLDERLASFTANVGAPGWAAFITADAVHEASPLPVPMPTQAVWSTGAAVAPYFRALKELRPVVLAVADATHADVYRYQAGTLTHVETVRAHQTVRAPLHMGDRPRQGYHVGVRGAAGRDEAQRSLLAGTNRMLKEAAERVVEVGGSDAWIVTGGIPEVAQHLADRLAERAVDRVLTMPVDVHASDADLTAAAQTAASTLRDAHDASRIAEIVDVAQANGLGALGPAATRETLEQGRVRELYMTHRYLEEHAAEAEAAVRAAIDQRALVEEVSGDAAAQLDAHGGMGARLRYRVESEVTSP